jgi:hypothetical protein
MILAMWLSQLSSTDRTDAISSSSIGDAQQKDLLEQNVDLPGDPVLGALYHDISERHFGGALPKIPVRWEAGLTTVDAGRNVTLQGMFGRLGDRQMILLNPIVQGDDAALRRALCHEIVHAYLFSKGDPSTTHGEAFRGELRRLAEAGAFEGIASSDMERTVLRRWLDTESTRLQGERSALEEVGSEIDRERASLDRDIAALNAEIAAANAGRHTGPSPEAMRELEERRTRFNQLVVETNARLERRRTDAAMFDREVARYNLMVTYPDGIDDAETPFGGLRMN